MSWKIGRKPSIFGRASESPFTIVRRVVVGNQRIDFGSRILFEPELAIGYRLSDRVSPEASWIHLATPSFSVAKIPGSTISGSG